MNFNMAMNILGVSILFFFVLLVEAIPDRICNKTEVYKTGKRKSVRLWRYDNGVRITYWGYVEVKKNRTISVCCKGYLQDCINTTSPTNTVTLPICIPQCEPPCMNGSACVKPNVCQCLPGYEPRNGTCEPVCSEPCNYGTCVEPETCKCLPGYRMTDVNVCTAVCSMGCVNGSCISPEVCHCNDGFSLMNGTCEPKCWPPCETGDCIAPDTCSCGPGYELVGSNMTSCEPICSPACRNGVCVGPNICMCDKGYQWLNGTCEPVCSKPCVNGTCVAPQTCECFERYEKNDTYSCFPKCTTVDCSFGTCISPEECLCIDGFAWINRTCMQVCSPPCVNGICTSSFDCHCNPGYQLKNGICEPESKWLNSDKQSTSRKMVTYANDEYDGAVGTVSFQNNEGTIWPETFTTVSNVPIEEALKSPVHWMYYVISILVLLIIVLAVILIQKRHSIFFCKGRSYIISGDQKNIANRHNIPDVTLSAIEESKANREGFNTDEK